MTADLLVTGARGFVMSVLIRELLDRTDLTVLAADREPADATWRAYLGRPGADRVIFHTCDVTHADAVEALFAQGIPRAVVHGATVTHDPARELRAPASFVQVNVQGTTNVLEAARRANVERVILVSSGAVYGSSSERVLTETSPLEPDELYGVSKVAGEQIAHRYAQLFGFPVPIVRLTKMFGPMERPSAGRSAMSLPYLIARSVVRREPLKITPRTLSAGGDWLSAVDAAPAIRAMLTTPLTQSRVYNLGTGTFTTVAQLLDLFGVTAVQVPAVEAAVDIDPELTTGKNGVYRSERARDELDWLATPLEAQVGHYRAWALEHPHLFAPVQ